MEIILVISDKKGKNILFILDDLQALTLKEAIKKTKKGEISGVHIVEALGGSYLRANPNTTKKDNLDTISIPLRVLTRVGMKEKTAAVRKYSRNRQRYLKECEKAGEKVIYIDGIRKGTEKEIIAHLAKHKNIILAAARYSKIDPNILGAILIDEHLRLDFMDKFDWLAELNTSIGIAQVKIETARKLIKEEYYNPNPKDKGLSKENIAKVSRAYLWAYLENPKHSIYFAGAEIRRIIDEWASFVDLAKKPEIIGTVYSLDKKRMKKPHAKPGSNDRGEQIGNEFYKIAKKALKP